MAHKEKDCLKELRFLNRKASFDTTLNNSSISDVNCTSVSSISLALAVPHNDTISDNVNVVSGSSNCIQMCALLSELPSSSLILSEP